MSLYAEYIREREGKEIVEDEKGFVTYTFVPEGCYVVDIYVKPEFRKQGHAAALTDVVACVAKGKGCSKLIGSVCPQAKGSTDSLKALLAYGFQLDSCAPNLIYLKKELT